MYKKFYSPFLALFTLIFSTVLSFNVAADEPLVFGHSETIFSKVLGQKKQLLIKLPEGYEQAKDKHYPVLYTLDGNTHYRRVAGMLEWLSDTSNTIPQHIVVAIVSDSSRLRLRDFNTRVRKQATESGADRYIRFLSRELIPHINNKYRTNDFSTLAGHSAAARFTVHAMSKAPKLFDAYIAMSPALSDRPSSVQYVKNIKQSLKIANRPDVFLFMTLGDEAVYQKSYDALVNTFEQHSALPQDQQSLTWQSMIYPMESHMSTPSKTLHDAMLAIAVDQGWYVPPKVVKQGLAAVTAHGGKSG